MRIISGKFKGRRIEHPKDMPDSIRPTSDFARESIFNILVHSKHGLSDHSFEEAAVLDLYCGTGAFGLEALSRGAKHVTFIDQLREAISIVKHNAERFGVAAQTDYMVGDCTKLSRAGRRYDLVFLDPPYFGNLVVPTLSSLLDGGWLAPDALVIIEHDAKEKIAIPEPFQSIDQRRYGRAMLDFLKPLSA